MTIRTMGWIGIDAHRAADRGKCWTAIAMTICDESKPMKTDAEIIAQLKAENEWLFEQLRVERDELCRAKLHIQSLRDEAMNRPKIPADSTPLTEDWLRDVGFTWEQHERSRHKNWTLWIGSAQREQRHGGPMARSTDNLGVEVAKGDDAGTWWYCWLRADYAGRYSRFIFARDVTSIEQLMRIIEALTDSPFCPRNIMYGALRTPEAAERFRRDEQRLDWRIAKDQARGYGEEDTSKMR